MSRCSLNPGQGRQSWEQTPGAVGVADTLYWQQRGRHLLLSNGRHSGSDNYDSAQGHSVLDSPRPQELFRRCLSYRSLRTYRAVNNLGCYMTTYLRNVGPECEDMGGESLTATILANSLFPYRWQRNGQMKRCPTSAVIREGQLNTAVRRPCTPVRSSPAWGDSSPIPARQDLEPDTTETAPYKTEHAPTQSPAVFLLG